jgi:general secretion pathway protein C
VTPREIRFAVNGLTGLVVLSVAAALANLTWRLAGEAGAPSAVPAAMDAYVRPSPPPDISGMIDLPPFGRTMAAASAGAAPADLVLHGVLMAVPASASSALIGSGGRQSAAYRLGDPLPGGMILNAIGVDYVMLRLGERYFTLYFPGDERAGQAASAAPPPAGGALVPPSPVSSPASSGSANFSVATPAPPPPPPTSPQIGNSGNALIDSLGATATSQGYRVGAALSPQLQAAGLLPGDVVASVNGISAARLAGDPRRLTQALASGDARLEVLRGGNRVVVSVPAR